jgi:O-antigen/teichoic acid export membrane protein
MNLRLCAEDGAVPAEQAERVQSSGRVLLGTVLLSTANISKLGLQLILVPILARLLGPSVFGLMSVAMSIVLLANMLSDGGMGSALVREQTRNRDLYSTVYWLSMGIGMFLAAMLCALSWPVAAIYRQPQLVPVLCALSPILILSSNLSVANAHIVRGQRFDLFAAGDFVCALASAAAGISLAIWGFGVWSLVAQQLALWTTKTAWVAWAAGFRPRAVFRLRLARPLFRFSRNNLAASFADFIGKSAPLLLVGAFLGVREAGHYSMAYQLTRIADTVVSNPINIVTFSAVAIAADRATSASFVMTSFRLLLLVLAPLFCGLALVADPLAPLLLGQHWLGTAPVLQALSLGAFLLCIYGFVTSALLGKGLSGRAFKLTLMTGLAISAGTLVGVRYGVTWAAAGFSLGTLALAPAYARSLAKSFSVPVSRLLSDATTSAIAAAAMALAIFVARPWIRELLPALQLLVFVGVGSVTYAGTAYSIAHSQIKRDFRKLRRRPKENKIEAPPDPAQWRFLPPDFGRSPLGVPAIRSTSL